MKQWIKLETDLMQDDRIVKLFSQFRLKGLATYFMIRLLSDSRKDCTVSYILSVVGDYIGRRFIDSILSDFDLFDVDESKVVSARICSGSHACAHTDAHTDAHRDAHTIADADVPLIVPSEHNIEKEREKKKRVSVSMLLKLTTSPQERAFYQEMLERFPRVCQMDKVLTYEQFQRIQAAGYTNQQIRDILQQMENNRHLLTKYVSAYLTLNNWIKAPLGPPRGG